MATAMHETTGGGTGRTKIECINPATLEKIGEVETFTEEDVRAALEKARKAFETWSRLSFKERGRYILAAREWLIAHIDDVAETVCQDTGKPRVEALLHDVMVVADSLGFYAKKAKKYLADEKILPHVMMNKKLRVSYIPMGVVGIITPWNYPFGLTGNPCAQALMAGNTVILKPSEVTSMVGLKVAEMFAAAGLPEDVFQLVTGDGSTGKALVEAGCDKISFIGSVEVGRKIAETCGRRLIPVTLELGGKDPAIVCEDADIERAANGAVWGAFANSGQTCCSIERVYVMEPVAKEFTKRVIEKTKKLKQGICSDLDIDVGAIISPPQIDIIEDHVRDAEAKGAKIETGGRRNPNFKGHFYEPTVLTNVTHDMKIMTEETFGPVLPIMEVRSEEEALRLSNDSPYGLNSSVWTRDKEKGKWIANRIQAGNSVVNDSMLTYGCHEAPWGGIKASGIGRVNGKAGLRGFCHTQSVMIDRLGLKSEQVWYPYSAKTTGMVTKLIRMLFGSRIGRLMN